MKTLRYEAIMATLKTGTWHQKMIPATLKSELEYHDRILNDIMYGFGFYDERTFGFVSFDLYWYTDSWFLFLNYGMDVDNRIASVRLSTNTRTYMPNIWADTFGLNWSDASIAGFWIQDFKISTQERKVIFIGDLVDDMNGSEVFTTEFQFYNEDQFYESGGMYLYSKTILQPGLTYSRVIMEREFTII